MTPVQNHPTSESGRLNSNFTNLIWIDLEMTGLDTVNDTILEIATIVTDVNLNRLAEGPVIAIHQSQEILDGMDAWNLKQHRKSGLYDRCLISDHSLEEAEKETLNFLSLYVREGASPMCGNSICQDRRFMSRCMPNLERFFHYKNLDVSSLGELHRYWYADKTPAFKKQRKHLALEDIRESIAELAHYRKSIFRDLNHPTER